MNISYSIIRCFKNISLLLNQMLIKYDHKYYIVRIILIHIFVQWKNVAKLQISFANNEPSSLLSLSLC